MSVYVDTRWLEPDAKPRAVRRHEEDDLQKAVCDFLRWAVPPDCAWFSIPNGGLRHRKVAQKLVATGLKAGVPDLLCIYRGTPIFIELKSARGALSEHQRQMHRKLTYSGATVLCCKSVDCVETALAELGVPLRARLS
jgi:hypothetical protein